MNKPIKPNITIPESFAKNGIKTDFDSDLIASGFDDLKPDVLAGDNLNKFIDDTYQGLNYGMAAADAINLINEGETLTVKEGQLVSDKISGGTGLQMFDTILKDHVLSYEESKGLELQGTYVYKEAIAGSRYGYPDFYNKCVEEYNESTQTETVNGATVKVHSNGHKFYNIADKTTIDEYFDSTGTVWMYGIDTENERVFLPRDKYFAVNGIAPVVGNGMTLGLTNGVDNCGLGSKSYASQAFTALYTNSYGLPVGNNTSGGIDSSTSFGVTTDSTKSGIEAHLQPNEDKYLYICVGNTTNYEGLTDVVNQGMEILEQVNQGIESRLNLDVSNISNEGKTAVTNMCMPDYSAGISITSGYVAPCAGFVYGYIGSLENQGVQYLYVNGIEVGASHNFDGGNMYSSAYAFVSAQDVVTFASIGTDTKVIFFPLKGAK